MTSRTAHPILICTLEQPPTHLIVDMFGMVVGVEARALNRFLDGVKTLVVGQEREFPTILVQARMLAVRRMGREAERLGANAVVGVRFDHRSLSDTWMELCAYGTAVTVTRLSR
jgi:uncharacterized protein YbjQ (UPF0145 family)